MNKAAQEMPEAVPSDWRKYHAYDLSVDPIQNDKAEEINICSMARPHMRAFHCAWWSFFVAFFVWFSISPLLSEIQDTLKMSTAEVWTSSISSVAGTVLVRFLIGPVCDIYGPRVLMSALLCLAAIPTACTGLVQSAAGLAVLRLFIGIAGGTFVACQHWTSSMFTLETVGLANGLTGGWGNLGAGVTHSVIGLLLFPMLKNAFDGDAERAWRTVCVIPAIVAFSTGILIYYVSDDTPKGNLSELKQHANLVTPSYKESFMAGATDLNTWLLSIQYACCFGVQLTMNNAAALYFKDEFGQSTESAAAIASVFSWMLLFARALGGFTSDIASTTYGMRGRLVVQSVFLICEGVFVLLFSNTSSLIGAICIMMIFSVFVNGATGSTFGIVPYVSSSYSGSVMGVIGAGGNIGAAIFGLLFQQLPYSQAFLIMGLMAIASSGLSFFVEIPGQSGLRRREVGNERHVGSENI